MTSPVSMPAGHEIVAADLDAYENLTAAWTAYTPTWTGLTIGNATVTARYRQVGKTVDLLVHAVMGSTTSFSSEFTVSAPVSPLGDRAVGSAFLFDASAGGSGRYGGLSFYASGIRVVVGNNVVASTSPFTWTTSDVLQLQMTYEVT